MRTTGRNSCDSGEDSRGPTEDGQFRRRVVYVIGAMLMGVAVVLIFWFQVQILLLAFAGVLLGVFLYTLSAWLSRWLRMPYWLSLFVTCVLLLAVLAGTLWMIGWRISQQVDTLQQQLPVAWSKVREYLHQRGWGRWMIGQVQAHLDEMGQQGLLGRGLMFLSSTGAVLADTFVVVFVGLFLAISPQLYVRGIMRLVPMRHRSRARELLTASGSLLWWWLVGQLISMAFIGVVTGLAVWLLGVPLALTLGILAALLNFIPNFGPIVATVPAALLAVLQGPMIVLWIIVAYVVIQLLQNHVVTPVVQQEAVRLPPVILILAQVFMYYWSGLLGMALAPPLAALAILLVEKLYVRDTLGDSMAAPQGFWPDDAKSRDQMS